jgi:hypothetical protein
MELSYYGAIGSPFAVRAAGYESWIMSSGERIIPIIPARWLTVENVPNITVEMTNQSSRVYSKVSNRAI